MKSKDVFRKALFLNKQPELININMLIDSTQNEYFILMADMLYSINTIIEKITYTLFIKESGINARKYIAFF
jgi:hypothetical protein